MAEPRKLSNLSDYKQVFLLLYIDKLFSFMYNYFSFILCKYIKLLDYIDPMLAILNIYQL
jgi:hypothetical protein